MEEILEEKLALTSSSKEPELEPRCRAPMRPDAVRLTLSVRYPALSQNSGSSISLALFDDSMDPRRNCAPYRNRWGNAIWSMYSSIGYLKLDRRVSRLCDREYNEAQTCLSCERRRRRTMPFQLKMANATTRPLVRWIYRSLDRETVRYRHPPNRIVRASLPILVEGFAPALALASPPPRTSKGPVVRPLRPLEQPPRRGPTQHGRPMSAGMTVRAKGEGRRKCAVPFLGRAGSEQERANRVAIARPSRTHTRAEQGRSGV